MGVISAIFSTKARQDMLPKAEHKPKQDAPFTEKMFDAFRKEHKAPKHTLADSPPHTKPLARTLANDPTLEQSQSMHVMPPLTD